MASYQVLNAPAGTSSYKQSFLGANVNPLLDTLNKDKRKTAIEAAIKQHGLVPEFKFDEDGNESTTYKKPTTKTYKKTDIKRNYLSDLVNPDKVLSDVKGRQEGGEDMDEILSQLDEASRKVIGLSGEPALSQEEIMMRQQDRETKKALSSPISKRAGFTEPKKGIMGMLNAWTSPDSATVTGQTRDILNNVKTMKDLVDLMPTLMDKKSKVDVDAIKEYFGEDVFNKALQHARSAK